MWIFERTAEFIRKANRLEFLCSELNSSCGRLLRIRLISGIVARLRAPVSSYRRQMIDSARCMCSILNKETLGCSDVKRSLNAPVNC